MDYFVEGIESEDSNDAQGEGCGEVEAALYSLVHHSTETYDSNIMNLTENYVSRRNKANRWEYFTEMAHSVNPAGSIIHTMNSQVSQAVDHIPIGYNSIAESSTCLHYNEHSKRGQNLKRAWSYHRNHKPGNVQDRNWKPWNVQDRIQNGNCMNRNLVPVQFQRNQITPHADSQEFAEVDNVQAFESYRRNLKNDLNINAKFSRGNVKCNESIFGVRSEKNRRMASTNENRIVNGVGHAPHTENLANYNGASTNIQQSKSIYNIDCLTGSIATESGTISGKNLKNHSKSENTSWNVNTSSKNTSAEIIVVSDSENDSNHSILEVTIPPKPEPPVIALDSSDEIESFTTSNAEPVLNVSPDSKTTDFPVENSNIGKTSQENNKYTKDSLPTVSANFKEIKKKKSKCVKIAKCETWTSGMIHFYNKSWGGETYDHLKVQQKMSNNPTNWKILEVDKYGPMPNYGPLARVRCLNCHQFGHMAKYCPDPRKIKCCTMCGERGHGENQCPNKLCLKCGRPAPLFNEGCPVCWKKDHPKNCTSCGANDHFQWMCPNEWRKFHSITTAEELQIGIWKEPQYKSSGELACCSCAGKGHTAAKCPFFTKHKQNVDSNKPPMNIFATMKLLKKKKNNKRRYHFDEGNNQHDYNRKRRKIS